MITEKLIEYNFRPVWDIFEKLHSSIENNLPDDKELIAATKMVATELVENAIKYGEGDRITFGLSTNGSIQISVTNQANNRNHIQKLVSTISEINNSTNLLELFQSRVMVLLNGGGKYGESQLGLYRVAYEGRFTLSQYYSDGRITVMASREVGR